jgi:hypothetical protein
LHRGREELPAAALKREQFGGAAVNAGRVLDTDQAHGLLAVRTRMGRALARLIVWLPLHGLGSPQAGALTRLSVTGAR